MGDEIRSIDDHIIDGVLAREGDRFTDDPNDRGGATKYGITQRAWAEYVARHPVSAPMFVRDIHEGDAREFYRAMYVQPLSWIADVELRDLVVDTAVQHGAHRAVTWLQRAVGCTVADGVIGPETRKLVNSWNDAPALYALMLIARLKFYADIATDQQPADPDAKFLRGWINRVCEFVSVVRPR